MSRSRISDKWITGLYGWAIVLAFLLPHTNTFLLLINPLLCVCLQAYSGKRISYKQNIIVVFPLIITLTLGVILQDVAFKAVAMTIAMIMYYYCFPLVRINKLPNKYLYICLVVIVISQMAYVLQIPYATDLLDTLYPIEGSDVNGILYVQSNATIDDVFEYRMGGLYRNANLCAMSLTLLLATYILLNYENSFRKNLVYVITCCIGILLTGSRTGFVVMSAIVVSYTFIDKKINQYWRSLVIIIIAIGLLYVMSTGSENYRALNVSSGLNDSISMKFRTFLYYITNEDSLLGLLFGYMDATLFHSASAYMNYFDSDYGNIIFCYGIIGFLAICYYFVTIFLKMDSIGKIYMITLLWMISAAIISSYRHLFIFMLLLTLIFQIHLRTQIKKKDPPCQSLIL